MSSDDQSESSSTDGFSLELKELREQCREMFKPTVTELDDGSVIYEGVGFGPHGLIFCSDGDSYYLE